METKRCAYCQKLQRADARKCSRCGHIFLSKRSLTRTITQNALPSASPHRAGHYSGLHPEDQPYQSSIMAAQHPPAREPEAQANFQHEPEHIVLPSIGEAGGALSSVTLPAQYNKVPGKKPARGAKRMQLPEKAISVILGLSCLFFLLASGIIAFVLVGSRPTMARAVVTVSPGIVRAHDTFTLAGQGFATHHRLSFTYDFRRAIFDNNNTPLSASTDDAGKFAVQIRVPADWSVGLHYIYVVDEDQHASISTSITVQETPPNAPRLQLGSEQVNFPAAASGIVSQKTLTLRNAGGGQILWRGSSDQDWLTLQPDSGTFTEQTTLQVMIHRDALAPKTYTGHVTFTQNGAPSSILTVTMEVLPVVGTPSLVTPTPVASASVTPTVSAPGNLGIAPSTLNLSALVGRSASSKALTLQNTGGLSVDWTAQVATVDRGQWLKVTPNSGSIAAGAQAAITVNADGVALNPGSYTGTLTFRVGNVKKVVSIAFSVTAPAIAVKPTALAFTTLKGGNPASQALVLTNTGNAPLHWGSTLAGNAASLLAIAPSQGMLAAGQSVTLTVSPNVTGANVGTLEATIALADRDLKGIVQQVGVSITIKDQAEIATSSSNLTFSTSSMQHRDAQSLSISDTGSRKLHWKIAQSDGTDASWLSVDTDSGTLKPGENTTIHVYGDGGDLAPGKYSAMLVVSDNNDAAVAPQTIHIDLTYTQN